MSVLYSTNRLELSLRIVLLITETFQHRIAAYIILFWMLLALSAPVRDTWFTNTASQSSTSLSFLHLTHRDNHWLRLFLSVCRLLNHFSHKTDEVVATVNYANLCSFPYSARYTYEGFLVPRVKTGSYSFHRINTEIKSQNIYINKKRNWWLAMRFMFYLIVIQL